MPERSTLARVVVTAAAGVALGNCGGAPTAPPSQPGQPKADAALQAVSRSALCVSAGRVEAPAERRLRVDMGGVRAVVASDRSHAAALAFVYRGPSVSTAPLASGELRRQIGLKLRAQDTCNVVYVMWHVEPSSGVFVSVKHNAGASTHGECGAGGYENLKPRHSSAAPLIEPGAAHVLEAVLDGLDIVVKADGNVVWRGELPASALEFDGPVGLRSDNGTFDFELRVPGGSRAGGTCP